MQELEVSLIEEVNGGLAFIPLLAATAVGSFVGGYAAGVVVKWIKEYNTSV